MRFALVNPPWEFPGSTYLGCREPHFPLEYGYALALLRREGQEAELIDGHMEGLTRRGVAERVANFRP
ncbi:MAG TPA: B12-binding domain-containing radical SAM protein, partial [Thermodesulfobacteriota bacterium]|nr:B12-binding domain-containing radical SAM protein [Thermodesulfobacteriota bacterium]